MLVLGIFGLLLTMLIGSGASGHDPGGPATSDLPGAEAIRPSAPPVNAISGNAAEIEHREAAVGSMHGTG